jgi:hypothetical protein
MSTFDVYAESPVRSSGAIQGGVPMFCVITSPSSASLEKPKSQMCTCPFSSSNTFRDFRSRRTIRQLCRNCIPRAMSNAVIVRVVALRRLGLSTSWKSVPPAIQSVRMQRGAESVAPTNPRRQRCAAVARMLTSRWNCRSDSPSNFLKRSFFAATLRPERVSRP